MVKETFKTLCTDFKPVGPKTQYAVLFIGELSPTYKLDPPPAGYDNDGLQIGKNYAAARFIKGRKHTEERIVQYADDLINRYKTLFPHQTPPFFLYTLNSPCCGSPLVETCSNGCAGKVADFLRSVRENIITTYIAWDQNYKLGAMPFDKAFLYSLNSVLSPGIATLSWEALGYCRKSPTPRGWFQKEMFNCLIQKVHQHPFCHSRELGTELAKMVNKVTWVCGTQSSYEDESKDYDPDRLGGISPARNPGCWKQKVTELDKASKTSCSNLADASYDCAESFNNVDLGPAILPEKPDSLSNNAADVKGSYPNLCFRDGSCQPPTAMDDIYR